MGVKLFVLILLMSIATDTWCHFHHHHHHRHHGLHPVHRKENNHVNFTEKKSNFKSEESTDTLLSDSLKKNERDVEVLNRKGPIPFNTRRIEKMLRKAIVEIIKSDLSTANMLLLKSLNYTPEQVMAIRKYEFDKQRDEELRKTARFNQRKFTDGNLRGNGAKHWNRNSMEFDSSGPYDPDVSKTGGKRGRHEERNDKNMDFDAYNRQAVVDYENLASKIEQQQQQQQQSFFEPTNFDYEDEVKNTAVEQEQDLPQNLHRSFDRAMEPHVIFKISYDDSEFDSSSSDSNERSRFVERDGSPPSKDSRHRVPATSGRTTVRNVANSFQASSLSATSSSPSSTSSAATEHTPLPIVYQLERFKEDVKSNYTGNRPVLSTTESPEPTVASDVLANITSIDISITNFNDSFAKNADNVTADGRINEYEGLEWIGEDVYRVIPALADSLSYVDDNETLDYDEQNELMNQIILSKGIENDSQEYQNDVSNQTRHLSVNVNGSVRNASLMNLSVCQQLMFSYRRDQGQKTLNNIRDILLEITGRRNSNTSTYNIQRERLTMFLPTCQTPRNTDGEVWTDPFSMNMHFQLNLTTDDRVVAAKLRIYKLPQENLANGSFNEDKDDVKKIRISVYYYTKSLKKHRSKKRLMDSIVVALTNFGRQLVLDVKESVKFWRLIPKNSPHSNANNHGLVIQIEDQDGQALKPALYLQQPTCADHESNQKFTSNLQFSSELVVVTLI